MKPSIVGCGTLHSGRPACVTTTRKRNAVFVFDGHRWHAAAEWGGKEVTAACACGDTVVCAALDDEAYLVRGADVVTVKLPEQSDWIYGAAALSDDVALLGGAGLFVLSVTDGSVTRRRLSEFNISRPGRDVLRIARTSGRTLVLGKKNLLVEYQGDSAVELVDRRAVGAELFFSGAAQLGSDLWLAGGISLRPFLAKLTGNSVQFEDAPLAGTSLPVLATLGDELLVGSDRLLAGGPGQWRELAPASPVGAGIVGMTPVPGPYPVCAVASDGTSYFTDGRDCVRIDLF